MRAEADRRAHDAQNALTRTYQLIDSWGEAELREFSDKWGIPGTFLCPPPFSLHPFPAPPTMNTPPC